jgi:hypothetical protein
MDKIEITSTTVNDRLNSVSLNYENGKKVHITTPSVLIREVNGEVDIFNVGITTKEMENLLKQVLKAVTVVNKY